MEWLNAHKEIELCHDNKDKLTESYCSIETQLTLLGKFMACKVSLDQ